MSILYDHFGLMEYLINYIILQNLLHDDIYDRLWKSHLHTER
jgi:hypothetical protein